MISVKAISLLLKNCNPLGRSYVIERAPYLTIIDGFLNVLSDRMVGDSSSSLLGAFKCLSVGITTEENTETTIAVSLR